MENVRDWFWNSLYLIKGLLMNDSCVTILHIAWFHSLFYALQFSIASHLIFMLLTGANTVFFLRGGVVMTTNALFFLLHTFEPLQDIMQFQTTQHWSFIGVYAEIRSFFIYLGM